MIDNALSYRVAELLRERRFDAMHVRELGMAHESDEIILRRAAQEDRVVISRDADFSGLLAQGRLAWPSFVHLRIPGLHAPDRQVELMIDVLDQVHADLETGAVVTIQEGRIRVRALPISKSAQ